MTQSVQAQDLFILKSVTQPIVAGDRIFFVENSVDQASNAYRSEVRGVSDGETWPAGSIGDQNTRPAVAGQRLYFAAKVGQAKPQLFTTALNGGQALAVTTLMPDQAVSTVLASEDQQTIFFKTTETTEQPKLLKTETFPQTRHISRLVNKADGHGWLPQHAVYRVWRYRPETDQLREVLSQGTDFELTSASADGRWLTLIQDSQPDNDRDFTRHAYCLDTAVHEQIDLTSDLKGQVADATISADGRRVLVVGNDGSHGLHTVANVYISNRETGELVNQTASLDADPVPEFAADFAQNPSGKLAQWLDGQHFVFTAAFHGHSQLYVGDGERVRLLDNQAREIVDFAVIDDDSVVLAVSAQDRPSLLVRHTLSDGNERILVNPNAAYEDTHVYAHPKHFNFEATDGQDLEGWYLPAQTTAKKTPVLLYVHGGPHANYGETFFYEFQVHASRGYGVVFFNPRGSTSYGQAYQDAVIGHYGEHDYRDVMSGLDVALAKFPELDADRQYIAGGSYGGFMTTWAVGHTTRFAAAVAQRSVTNWISLFGTSDIGFYFNPDELAGDLFDEGGVSEYWQRSPLAYAQNVTTPIRLLHGEWDMRCPISQSEEFFTAVKRHGVDADMIRYPQSFHGVSRHGLPSLRVQRIDDMTAWFNAHPSVKK